MTMEDFERELTRQPLRPIPAEWRTRMLRAAAASQSSAPLEGPSSFWREFLWPSPRAWASLAATWLAILVANIASRDPVIPSASRSQLAPPSGQLLMALKQQRQLLAELMDISGAAPPPEAEAEPGRPRSEAGSTRSHA